MTDHPLVLHSIMAAVVFCASVALWLILEMVLGRREPGASGGKRQPEASMSLIWVTVAVSWLISYIITKRQITPLPGAAWWPFAIGLTMMWTGIALRTWAIVVLGVFFKHTVVIQDNHRVIDHGPYRWMRHPCYSGAIVTLWGMGVASGTALGVAIMLLGPLTAFAVRIHVEERALLCALGNDYAAYARRTARLIPGLY